MNSRSSAGSVSRAWLPQYGQPKSREVHHHDGRRRAALVVADAGEVDAVERPRGAPSARRSAGAGARAGGQGTAGAAACASATTVAGAAAGGRPTRRARTPAAPRGEGATARSRKVRDIGCSGCPWRSRPARPGSGQEGRGVHGCASRRVTPPPSAAPSSAPREGAGLPEVPAHRRRRRGRRSSCARRPRARSARRRPRRRTRGPGRTGAPPISSCTRRVPRGVVEPRHGAHAGEPHDVAALLPQHVARERPLEARLQQPPQLGAAQPHGEQLGIRSGSSARGPPR